MVLLLFLVIAFQSVLSAPASDDLVVTLANGKIRGRTVALPGNKTYYTFRGIPFATPPLGKLRFEAPQPAKPWKGILNATEYGSSCASYQQLPNESEDCLFINVHTPSIKPHKKLTVMVYIFGGAFMAGDPNIYGPGPLTEKNVAVVTFNHRVGDLGFLSTGDTAIRGNAALKDQLLALKWTKENIASFGGDPEQITVFSHSSGTSCLALITLNPQSKGLYRGVILQSASGFTVNLLYEQGREHANAYADALGGGEYKNDTQKLKAFLQEKSITEIINVTTSFFFNGQQPWPVIEAPSDDAFLTESPYTLLKAGKFVNVPIMIGITPAEYLLLWTDLAAAKSQAASLDTNALIPINLHPNSTDEKAVVKAIHDIYLKKNETFANNLVAALHYLSDNNLARGTIKHAELASNYTSVRMYVFSKGDRPLTNNQLHIEGAERAGHGAELGYIFNIEGVSNTTAPADLLTQERMVTLWTNFAKYLNPTPEASELFQNIIWPTISPTNLRYLNINDTLSLHSSIEKNSYPKWEKIYQKYGRKPFVTF